MIIDYSTDSKKGKNTIFFENNLCFSSHHTCSGKENDNFGKN